MSIWCFYICIFNCSVLVHACKGKMSAYQLEAGTIRLTDTNETKGRKYIKDQFGYTDNVDPSIGAYRIYPKIPYSVLLPGLVLDFTFRIPPSSALHSWGQGLSPGGQFFFDIAPDKRDNGWPRLNGGAQYLTMNPDRAATAEDIGSLDPFVYPRGYMSGLPLDYMYKYDMHCTNIQYHVQNTNDGSVLMSPGIAHITDFGNSDAEVPIVMGCNSTSKHYDSGYFGYIPDGLGAAVQTVETLEFQAPSSTNSAFSKWVADLATKPQVITVSMQLTMGYSSLVWTHPNAVVTK